MRTTQSHSPKGFGLQPAPLRGVPKSRTPLSILWAVDPFEKKSETQAAVTSFLRRIATKSPHATIQPVYILSPSEFDLSLSFSEPWVKEYENATKKVMDQCLTEANLPGLLPPKMIIQRHPSLRQSARSLLTYARRSEADMIAVGTHARKGIFRFFIGSFAETLLLYSKTPLLVINPTSESKDKNLEKILFATDFGKHTPQLFKKVLEFARNLQSEITLFHAISHPVEPLIQSGMYLFSGAWVQWPDFLSRNEQEKRKMAQTYVSLAREKGVPMEVTLSTSHTSVSSQILKHAERSQVSLIAMAAESGLVATTLIGSITRQVVREAPCPIWVMHL